MELVSILVRLLIAWIGYTMAKTRNREPMFWAVFCFLFGIFAVIVLLLIGDAEE